MNDEQYKRFRKMRLESEDGSLKCLYSTRDDNKTLYFLIQGVNSKYKVSINLKGQIKCSCPDFTHTCKVQECICKHCLYVVYIKLGLFKDIEHSFYRRNYFTPDEISSICKIKF